MAIATGTALAIAALAGGTATSLYGANKQAGAAKDAAAQQVASAEQAKADLRPLYEANVARMDPYAQLGGQAVGQLRALGGFGAPPALAPGGSAARTQVAIPFDPNNPANAGIPQQPMNMSDPRVQALAKGASLADLGGGRGSAYEGPSTGTAVPRATVRLMAPDGEVREFPPDVAMQLERQYGGQGVRRVG